MAPCFHVPGGGKHLRHPWKTGSTPTRLPATPNLQPQFERLFRFMIACPNIKSIPLCTWFDRILTCLFLRVSYFPTSLFFLSDITRTQPQSATNARFQMLQVSIHAIFETQLVPILYILPCIQHPWKAACQQNSFPPLPSVKGFLAGITLSHHELP